MKKFVIPMIECEEPYRNGELKSEARILVKGKWAPGFMVGAIAKGGAARKVYKGPLVPGPWAFAFAVAGVIDCRGGTKRELDEAKAAGLLIEAEFGDVLEIDGCEYVIRNDHNDAIELERKVA